MVHNSVRRFFHAARNDMAPTALFEEMSRCVPPCVWRSVSRPWTRIQLDSNAIAIAQDIDVVLEMAADDEDETTRAERPVVHRAASTQGDLVERFHQRDGGGADGGELVNEVGKIPRVGIRRRNVAVFVEARERRLI